MHPAKYKTGAQTVERLRELATQAAADMLRPLVLKRRAWRKKRPIDQKRQEARLTTICACIEVITGNAHGTGNYMTEIEEAIGRAREVSNG